MWKEQTSNRTPEQREARSKQQRERRAKERKLKRARKGALPPLSPVSQAGTKGVVERAISLSVENKETVSQDQVGGDVESVDGAPPSKRRKPESVPSPDSSVKAGGERGTESPSLERVAPNSLFPHLKGKKRTNALQTRRRKLKKKGGCTPLSPPTSSSTTEVGGSGGGTPPSPKSPSTPVMDTFVPEVDESSSKGGTLNAGFNTIPSMLPKRVIKADFARAVRNIYPGYIVSPIFHNDDDYDFPKSHISTASFFVTKKKGVSDLQRPI